MVPNDLKYTKSHEWVRIEGVKAVFGITDHAVDEIRDIIFLELKKPGEEIEKGKPFGTIESVKAVFELFAPISGTVKAVNQAILDHPETLTTKSAFGNGWLMELSPKDRAEMGPLMDANAYEQYLKSESSAH